MIYEQQIRAVDPVALAIATGTTKIRRFSSPTPPVVRPFLLTDQLQGMDCGCPSCGLGIPPDYGTMGRFRGLGFNLPSPSTFDMNALQVPSQGSGNISLLQTAALGSNFIPGVGQIASVALTTLNQFLNQFEKWFGIGAGRREADLIVPTQNSLMTQLGTITNGFLVTATPSVDDLIAWYRQVWSLAVGFQEFVLMKNFTDRRASGQALNTVMPYIDGTCGYAVPVGPTATPGQSNCLSWGDGTIGGVGTDGMLGALRRAIINYGGEVPALTDLHAAANSGIKPSSLIPGQGGLPATIMGVSTPLAFVLGIAVLMMYKGRL